MARIRLTRRSTRPLLRLILRSSLPLSNPYLCDSYSNGVCLVCKQKWSIGTIVTVDCKTCKTPWHLPGLTSTIDWKCPDCSHDPSTDEEEIVGETSKPTTETNNEHNDMLDNYCSFCIDLLDRPVTVSFFHFPLFFFP